MSDVFRALLRKVGSGSHTSEALNREEAALATQLMLTQEATPAQIGAFMIAHRIKRPTSDELAGLLDTYQALGPRLPPRQDGKVPLALGLPYDGRNRTAPFSPLTALILAAAGQPMLFHGGRSMPTKYGVPLVDLWHSLGVEWRSRSLPVLSDAFASTNVALIYQPDHFPLAEQLVIYRHEIGKRPPLATIELVWSAYSGPSHIVAGFVHPPTEAMLRGALLAHGIQQFTFIKGLEGSCDLPRDRTVIASTHHNPAAIATAGEAASAASPLEPLTQSERLLIHPSHYGHNGPELPYTTLSDWTEQAKAALAGEASDFSRAVVWNAGFYLWLAGLCPDIATGLAEAQMFLETGKAAAQLQLLQQVLGSS